MDPHTVASLAQAVADPNRLRVYELADGKTSISEIAQRLGLSSASITHHVGVLRDAGLVHVLGHGRRHLPRRTPEALRQLVDALALADVGRT